MIKHNKSRSFAQRYNEEHSMIHLSNQRLSVRLERMKPSSRYLPQCVTEGVDKRSAPVRSKMNAETDK